MAISYTPVDIRGVAVEPILEEVLFANKTIAELKNAGTPIRNQFFISFLEVLYVKSLLLF